MSNQEEIELLTLISDLTNSKDLSRKSIGAEIKRLTTTLRVADQVTITDYIPAETLAVWRGGINISKKKAIEARQADLAVLLQVRDWLAENEHLEAQNRLPI